MRLPALLLSALIIVSTSLPCVAQSSCPVVVEGVKPVIAPTGAAAQNHNASAQAEGTVRLSRQLKLTVDLRNVSGKAVRGVRVLPAFYDSAGELHVVPPGIIAFQPFPAAQTVPVYTVTPLLIGEDRAVGWLAVIQKVIYEDGVRWEFSAATPACFGQWWADSQHPGLTTLPAQEKFLAEQTLDNSTVEPSLASSPDTHTQPAPASADDDYPMNRAGIFLKGSDWKPVTNQNPFKTKAAHSIAASLSYGLVPAKVVAEYEGDHAPTQAENAQPILCICHLISIPGQPVIVRLHPKKTSRELDGGKMIVYPVVGGSKTADANKTDLIPIDVAHPDPQVWIVRPQAVLPSGEYALMLGTQNISIFPFTVAQ